MRGLSFVLVLFEDARTGFYKTERAGVTPASRPCEPLRPLAMTLRRPKHARDRGAAWQLDAGLSSAGPPEPSIPAGTPRHALHYPISDSNAYQIPELKH